jgi:hypothetical protein
MQDVVVRKNTFKDNHYGDVVVCAGSELLFADNVFEKTVYIWGRTHNYSFINNQFNGGIAGFKSRTGVATIEKNSFKRCAVLVEFDAKKITNGFNDETDTSSHTAPLKLAHNTFIEIEKFTGTYFDLEHCTLDAVRFIAGPTTQLIQLHKCVLKNTGVNYQGDGPTIYFSTVDCEGTLFESGAGIGRKRLFSPQ